MGSTELELLLTALTLGGVGVLVALFVRAQRRRWRELDELAARLGLKTKRDGPLVTMAGELEGRYGVTATEWSEGSAKAARIHCRVSVDAPFGFPTPMGVATRTWAKRLLPDGEPRVMTGNADLDRAFVVRSPQPDAAREALLGPLGRSLARVSVKHDSQELSGSGWSVMRRNANLRATWVEQAIEHGLEIVRVAEGENANRPRPESLREMLARFGDLARERGFDLVLDPFTLRGKHHDLSFLVTLDRIGMRLRVQLPRAIPGPFLVVTQSHRNDVLFPCPELPQPTGDSAFDDEVVVCATDRSLVSRLLDESLRAELIRLGAGTFLRVDSESIQIDTALFEPSDFDAELARPIALVEMLHSRLDVRDYRGKPLA